MPRRVPVIDLSALARAERLAATSTVIEQIGEAARRWGFFQVTGHRFPQTLIDRVWAMTHAFFALPRDVKLSVMRSKANPRGYYDRELTKNRRDLKEVFDFGDETPHAIDGANQWPATLPDLKRTMLEHFGMCERLAVDLLAALAVALGVPAETLAPHFRPTHTSFARLNHYPREDPLEPDAASRAQALGDQALHHHTDAGTLTILLQDDVGGLEMREGDRWLEVEPVEGALVVNIGDMMQVWSNDRLAAAMHRVRPVRDRPRYSIPFFFNPSYETDYAPLPTPDGAAPRYRAINWGAFRQARTDGDYADYGREIQISDFRVGD